MYKIHDTCIFFQDWDLYSFYLFCFFCCFFCNMLHEKKSPIANGKHIKTSTSVRSSYVFCFRGFKNIKWTHSISLLLGINIYLFGSLGLTNLITVEVLVHYSAFHKVRVQKNFSRSLLTNTQEANMKETGSPSASSHFFFFFLHFCLRENLALDKICRKGCSVAKWTDCWDLNIDLEF